MWEGSTQEGVPDDSHADGDISAMVHMDAKLAGDVCDRDKEVDEMKRQVRVEAEKMIQADPTHTKPLMRMMAASRGLVSRP